MKPKFKVGDRVGPTSRRGQRIWKGLFGNAKSGRVTQTISRVGWTRRNGYEVKVGDKLQEMFSYELEKV